MIVPRFARPFQTITSLYASRRPPGLRKVETLVDYLAQPHKNTTSTVFKGTSFELEAKEALEQYGMRLRHSGGPQDKGVDLRGTWPLAACQEPPPLVIAQCKNFNKKCMPDHVRSLIGTVVSESRTAPTIGVLVTSDKDFTKNVMAAFKECELPLALAKIADCKVKSLLLNTAAEDLLPGYAFTTRFTKQGTSEVVLTFDGCIVEFADLTSKEVNSSSKNNVM